MIFAARKLCNNYFDIQMQLTKGERSLYSRTLVTPALSLKQYENVCSRHVNAFQIENMQKRGK